MSRADTPQLLAVTLLRIACALLVVLYHIATVFPFAPDTFAGLALQGAILSRAAVPISWFGWIGVEIFFVISGFVIVTSATGVGARGFLTNRLLRLVPAAWLCATLTLCALLATIGPHGELAGAFLRSILFVPFGSQIDSVYWTLGIEVSFYVMVAMCLRDPASKALRIERLVTLIGLSSAAYWAWCVSQPVGVATPGTARLLDVLLVRHGCLFAVGATLAILRSRQPSLLLLLLLAVSLGASCLETIDKAQEVIRWTGVSATPMLPLTFLIGAIAIVAGAGHLQPLLACAFSGRTITILGLATYPLYLLHQNVGAAIVGLLSARHIPFWQAGIVAALIPIVMSLLIVRYAEPGLRRRIARVVRNFDRLGSRPQHA